MNKILRNILICTSLAGLKFCPTLFAAAAPKPNIIFILADDYGVGEVSAYGADNYKTPHIDQLARGGIRFTHAYTPSLCGPSRATILTGRYLFRTGATNQDATGQMSSAEIMIQGSGIYWNTQAKGKNYKLNGQSIPLRDNEYLPDLMHAHLVDFITKNHDRPFYAYYSLSHVHTEILPTPDSAPGSQDLYGDNVTYMDKLIGKLIAELERQHLREKTLIVFFGDNGTAEQRSNHATIGGRRLNGAKGSMLEGGSLEPLIVNWPGVSPAGRICDDLIDSTDFLPTFAAVASAKLPVNTALDGHNFLPQIQGEKGQPRDWVFLQLAN
ncbi:MAG: hypothetical protein EBT98_10650, partial [Opitutaceae bacterium]|nr:hypothetical protein [Opitutaceae bacterium]